MTALNGDWASPGYAGRYVARVRRMADLSQRELADVLGVNRSTIGAFEAGERPPGLARLAEILDVAGLRLVVMNGLGERVEPFREDSVRDRAGRRFPPHLDVVPGDERAPKAFRFRPELAPPGQPSMVQRPARDLRRARCGHSTADQEHDHPSAADMSRHARLVLRHPRVTTGVAPSNREPPECTCPDACFEATCVADCGCRCEAGGA